MVKLSIYNLGLIPGSVAANHCPLNKMKKQKLNEVVGKSSMNLNLILFFIIISLWLFKVQYLVVYLRLAFRY